MTVPKRGEITIVDQFGNDVRRSYPGALRDPQTYQLGIGGPSNALSGAGGPTDKSEWTSFTPTLIATPEIMETIYGESWVAKKFVDMPIDDMFFREREFTSDDEEGLKRFTEAYDELNLMTQLSNAMKCGRLFGTGLLVLVIKGEDMTMPLDIDTVRPGSLCSALVFDRYQANIEWWDTDIESPNYGCPDTYHITPSVVAMGKGGMGNGVFDLYVHHSRVMRFDGRRSLQQSGWRSAYERDWGLSELVCAMTEISHDSLTAKGLSHLMQEASIPVVRADGFRDTLTGEVRGKDLDATSIAQGINMYKSIFRLMLMDKEDEFERVNVSFTGMKEVTNLFVERVAAVAEIPITRFVGRQAIGLSGKGEGDLKNYSLHVESMRARKLRLPLSKLDRIVAKHVGLKEPPDYKWIPIADLSDLDRAQVASLNMQAYATGVQAGILKENEVREQLSGDRMYGDLPELSEEELMPPMPEESDPFA